MDSLEAVHLEHFAHIFFGLTAEDWVNLHALFILAVWLYPCAYEPWELIPASLWCPWFCVTIKGPSQSFWQSLMDFVVHCHKVAFHFCYLRTQFVDIFLTKAFSLCLFYYITFLSKNQIYVIWFALNSYKLIYQISNFLTYNWKLMKNII